MTRIRRNTNATNKGWVKIPKPTNKFERTFKYTHGQICQECGKQLKQKIRFCNILCKNKYYDQTLEIEKEVI